MPSVVDNQQVIFAVVFLEKFANFEIELSFWFVLRYPPLSNSVVEEITKSPPKILNFLIHADDLTTGMLLVEKP